MAIGAKPPTTKPVAFRVERVGNGYEIRKDGQLVGEDSSRREANQAALELAAAARADGEDAVHYPCLADGCI